MAWRKSQQKKLWTNWICFKPDLEKLNMFQSRFGKIDKFITADADTQFTSMEFKDECQTCGVNLLLAAPEHQDMKGQVEVP